MKTENKTLEEQNRAMKTALIERENKNRGIPKQSDGFVMKSKSYSYHLGNLCFSVCYETSYPAQMEISPFLKEFRSHFEDEIKKVAGDIWIKGLEPFVMYNGNYWHIKIHFNREWCPNAPKIP